MFFSVIMAMLKIMKLEGEEISVRKNSIVTDERISSLNFVKSVASRIPSLIEQPPTAAPSANASKISLKKSSVASSGRISNWCRCP